MAALSFIVNYFLALLTLFIFTKIIKAIMINEKLLVLDPNGKIDRLETYLAVKRFLRSVPTLIASNRNRKASKRSQLAYLLTCDPLRFGWPYTCVLSVVVIMGPFYVFMSYGDWRCLFAVSASCLTSLFWLLALTTSSSLPKDDTVFAVCHAPSILGPDSACAGITQSGLCDSHWPGPPIDNDLIQSFSAGMKGNTSPPPAFRQVPLCEVSPASSPKIDEDDVRRIVEANSSNDRPLPFRFVTARFLLMLLVCTAPFSFYFATTSVTSAHEMHIYDKELADIDNKLLGWLFPYGQLALWLDENPYLGPKSFFGKVFGDFLTAMYVTYYAWPVVSLLYIFIKCVVQERMAGPRHEYAAWSICETMQCSWVLAFMTTFLCNFIFPAQSPRLYMKELYKNSIEQTAFRRFLAPLIHQDSTYGSFPSGHVGETLGVGIAAYALHVWPMMSRMTIYASAFVALATLWLRYHYFIDVVCAVIVAFWARWASGATSNPDMDCLALIPAVPAEQAPLSYPEEILSVILKKRVILFKRIPEGHDLGDAVLLESGSLPDLSAKDTKQH